MNNLVKNIFTTIIAITLLIGTAGFQIFKHMCSTHNFSEVSLVEIPQCEEDHFIKAESDDCCKVEEIEETDCCESRLITKQIIQFSASETECCGSDLIEKRIDENIYPPSEKRQLKIDSEPVQIIKIIETECRISESSYQINDDLPPPKFGKELLNTLHQLKLDSPSC